MNPDATLNAETSDPKAVAKSYLDAAEARDVAACVGHYAPDATLTFMSGVFEGHAAIEDWHKERFAANMRFVRIDAIKVKGDAVTVDAVITSDRLKAWKLTSLGGRATFRVRDGKIKETTFGLRLHNPLEGW
jgi:ketosteroid isomerase-like protein